MNDILRRLVNVFFPRTCEGCGVDIPAGGVFALCDGCRGALFSWDGFVCAVCGVPLKDGGERCYVCRGRSRRFKRCRSVGVYEGLVKKCVLRLKYHGKDFLAAPLGVALAEEWARWREYGLVQAVLPVPLPFWRRVRRGFNQAELLAAEFCRETGLPLMKGVLRRRKSSPSQTGLRRDDRFENVSGVFSVQRPESVKGKTLLVVDDVCTTGATLEECAGVLKEAGARAVYALTVARQM